MTEWSECQTRNRTVPGSSPALTATWIYFDMVVPSSNRWPCL